MEVLLPWVADLLAVVGLVVLTISVYGLLRMRDIALRLHAAGKAGLMGVLPLLIASVLAGNGEAVPKAVLVGAFLVLTTPVVAHEIGRAVYLERQRAAAPGEADTPRQ